MLEKLENFRPLADVIDASIGAVHNSLTTLSKLSEVDKFYWRFISSCCKCIQLGSENLATLNIYSLVINKLGKIFQEYCKVKDVSRSITDKVPEEINSVLSAEVQEYFTWIHKMHGILFKWQTNILNKEFNYDDVFTYETNLSIITDIAKALNAHHLVISNIEITGLSERYYVAYGELYSLLVQGNNDYGW